MDRSVMEGNPHAVLEGMMIAGKAMGADEGVVYVRAEYPLAVKRMRHAIAQAEEFGTGVKREFVYLFTHSILHLLGYDHMEDEEKREMRAREEEILCAIGVTR